MNTLRMTILSFVLLLIVATPRAKAQTADDVITKHIEALGGKDKLLSIKSLYMEGVAVMSNGTEIDTKTWKVKDKLYRQEISFGMGNVVIIVTPTKGWSSNPRDGGAFKPLPDDALKAALPQMDPSGPFVDYAAKGNKVELLGKDTVGAKNCFKLKVTFPAGQDVTYFVDDQTYYIIRESRKGGMMGGGGGGGRPRDPNATFNIDFADYQKTADGYVFPNTIIAGGFGAKTTVEKMDVNKVGDEEKLEKPGN